MELAVICRFLTTPLGISHLLKDSPSEERCMAVRAPPSFQLAFKIRAKKFLNFSISKECSFENLNFSLRNEIRALFILTIISDHRFLDD